MNIVALDGPERTGKSTQIKLLEKYLIDKGKKVQVNHTSFLLGKDVTHSKLEHATKFYAYAAALQDVTSKLLKLHGIDYVILDRFLLTHLVYSARYWPPTYAPYNKIFAQDILTQLRHTKFKTIVLLHPYIKDASYDSDLIGLFNIVTLPNTTTIQIQDTKENIHNKIKEVLKI